MQVTDEKITPPASPERRLEEVLTALEKPLERGLARLGGRKDGEPIRELHIELTHRCNLKCIMCHHWEMPFKDPGSVSREMGLDQIRGFVTGSKLLKDVEIVVITGGEPMMKPEIVDVVGFLAGHFPKSSIGVLTNLWNHELVRRRLLAFREAGAARVWLGSSLDGLEKKHDEIRGRKGAFRGLVRSVEMLRKEFPGVDFSFSLTVTPKNYKELWPAYRFVSGMGLWFGAQLVVNHRGLEAPETFNWKKKELEAVEAQIDLILMDLCLKERAWERLREGRAAESLWLWTRLLYWAYLKKYARKQERFFKDCMAGQRYAMLDPEGNLFYCPVNKHRTIGSVAKRSFDAVWTSAEAERERRYVDSCSCDCWLNCIANPILDRGMALGFGKSWGKAYRDVG